MNTARRLEYNDVVQSISYMLFQALWEREPDLDLKVHEVDSLVNKLLRRIGFLVVGLLLAELSNQVTQQAKATGLAIHRARADQILIPVWCCRNAISLPME